MENASQALVFPCPCCGLPTLDEQPPGTFLICPVCWWEDDRIQFERPNLTMGANLVSLSQARHNYQELGISDPQLRRYQHGVRTIRFSFDCQACGAVVNLADTRHGYKMVPTCLSDALGDLIDAVNHVFELGSGHCAWADEPGEWVWQLERQNNDLHIQVLRFREWHLGGKLDPQSQTWSRDFEAVVFETRCNLPEFAAEVQAAAESVLSDRTIEQYEREWRHPYPRAAVERLLRHLQR